MTHTVHPTAPDATDDAVKALVGHLAELYALLKELHQTSVSKLAAMRKADAPELQRCATREARLLEQVFRLARFRSAVIARVAQGLPGSSAGASTLNEIVAQLCEPVSSSLRARMRGLQDVAMKLQESNRVASVVARELHLRVRELFASLANAHSRQCGYGPQGREMRHGSNALFEAVG